MGALVGSGVMVWFPAPWSQVACALVHRPARVGAVVGPAVVGAGVGTGVFFTKEEGNISPFGHTPLPRYIVHSRLKICGKVASLEISVMPSDSRKNKVGGMTCAELVTITVLSRVFEVISYIFC